MENQAPPPFRIVVTGDTGFDIFTEYVQGYRSGNNRVQRPICAYDIEVPSGAELTYIGLRTMLGGGVDVDWMRPEKSRCDWQVGIPHTPRQFITMPKSHVELKKFGDVTRAKRTMPLMDHASPKNDVFDTLVSHNNTPVTAPSDLLVIHDGAAGTWREHEAADQSETTKLLRNTFTTTTFPSVVVNLSHDMPEVVRQPEDGIRKYRSHDKAPMTMWSVLEEKLEQVCIVISANVLRREGATLSRRLSWEQTIEDFFKEARLIDKLSGLARFRHLVIRFGVSGVLHVETIGNSRNATLLYAPNPTTDFFRDVEEDGMLLNQNTFLVAAVAKGLSTAKRANASPTPARPDTPSDVAIKLREALKSGLQALIASYVKGYSLPWHDLTNDQHKISLSAETGQATLNSHFSSAKEYFAGDAAYMAGRSLPESKESLLIAHADLDLTRIDRVNQYPGFDSYDPPWELLKDSIEKIDRDDDAVAANDRNQHSMRLNIGMAIAFFGGSAVLNRAWDVNPEESRLVKAMLERNQYIAGAMGTPDYMTLEDGRLPEMPEISMAGSLSSKVKSEICAPLMRLADVSIIERQEVEGLRSIRNLFRSYIQSNSSSNQGQSPLSIAVFGSPGSGKSFIVKQIAKDINKGNRDRQHELVPKEFNVSQFRSVDDIGEAIVRASTVNNYGKIPLVFFDEFDSAKDGKPLGWLKYFLAPMQDGTYYGTTQTIHIARAIFVFAGGVYPEYAKFDPAMQSGDKSVASKDASPVNEELFRAQKGPDFISRLRGHIDILPLDSKEGQIKPILRRAFLLRSLLEKYKLTTKERVCNVSTIDEDIAFALLTIDRYRHGARSLEAIIQMCGKTDGRIEKASLPSTQQLNMHVNAEEFHIRILRGRYLFNSSSQPPPPQESTRSVAANDSSHDDAIARGRAKKKKPAPSHGRGRGKSTSNGKGGRSRKQGRPRKGVSKRRGR